MLGSLLLVVEVKIIQDLLSRLKGFDLSCGFCKKTLGLGLEVGSEMGVLVFLFLGPSLLLFRFAIHETWLGPSSFNSKPSCEVCATPL